MASTKKKQQYKTQGTQAREAARTAGHAARRQIDLQYSAQRRMDSRAEHAAEERFKGSLPIWGGRNPLTGAYEFRPGAKEGFWESRSSDWIGQERNAAGGQADWTKIQSPLVKRQPNRGFGFIGGKIMDSIGSRLGNGGQQLQAAPPRPQLAMGAGAAVAGAAAGAVGPAAAGAARGPTKARLKPNSAQPAGPRMSATPAAGDLESGVLGLESGVLGLPAPGGEVRNPGEPRRLPGNTGRPALGTGGGGRVRSGGGYSIESEYGGEVDEGPDRFAGSKARIAAVAGGLVSPANERLRYSAPGRFAAQAGKAHAAWMKTDLGSPYDTIED